MQKLAVKGLGHTSITNKEANCDAEAVKACLKQPQLISDCEKTFDRCYSNGFRMILAL
jgi:hypothetical protein